MTREEKAKAYEEALEKAREIKEKIIYSHLSTESCKAVSEYIDTIIPELAESEEEKIRKALIEVFKKKLERGFEWVEYGIPNRSVLDWLEKQKECVSNNFDDVWNEEDCEEVIAEGQKLTPRFKELLKEVCHAWYDKGAKLEKQKSGLSFVGDFQAKTLQGPIELAEWKEAAKIREWILAKMQELAATGVPCSDEIKMADKAIDYLIKQKEYIEEPKIAFRDWGDKEKKEAIITCLKYMRFIKKITNQEYDDLIKWLNNTVSNVSEKEECLREVKQKEEGYEAIPVESTLEYKFGCNDRRDSVKQKEQKVDIDKEKLIRHCIGLILTDATDERFKDYGLTLKECLTWLGEQKEQKPAEWSEEDEKDMAHIIRILDDCYVYGTHDLSKTDRENLVNKLKSLRPHWKPSEEHLEALLNTLHPDDPYYHDLKSLYEHLKKLM